MTEILSTNEVDTAQPPRNGIDFNRMQSLVHQLLEAFGEDPDRDGLKDTPRRAAALWSELLAPELGTIDSVFAHESVEGQWVAVSGIEVWTLCEHHLAPMHVTVTIGYLPAGQVIGLSKLVRIARKHAAGLQLQERLTTQIAQTVHEMTGSPDVGVWAVGEHLCMSMRGVKAERTRTSTACMLGRFHTEPALSNRLIAAAKPDVQ